MRAWFKSPARYDVSELFVSNAYLSMEEESVILIGQRKQPIGPVIREQAALENVQADQGVKSLVGEQLRSNHRDRVID